MKNITGLVKKHWYILILFFLPVICTVALLFLTGNKSDIGILIPVWNDEIGWWTQVDAVTTYGMPLGYEGYNATHAKLGTFGPWGAAAIYPYALFGVVFGWSLHSMAIANMFYLGLALALFGILTGERSKQYGSWRYIVVALLQLAILLHQCRKGCAMQRGLF